MGLVASVLLSFFRIIFRIFAIISSSGYLYCFDWLGLSLLLLSKNVLLYFVIVVICMDFFIVWNDGSMITTIWVVNLLKFSMSRYIRVVECLARLEKHVLMIIVYFINRPLPLKTETYSLDVF